MQRFPATGTRSNASPLSRARAARLICASAVAALTVGPSTLLAQYEVPDPAWSPGTYYNGINVNSGTFKADLNNLIDGHTNSSYDSATTRLPVLDPGTSGNVVLVYSGYQVDATWDSGVTWNREHLWPDSYGIDGSGTDYGDLYNLRACDPGVNSDRGNNYYENIAEGVRVVANPDAPLCWQNSNSSPTQFEPRPGEKGDLARAMFYMDTRYDGADSGTTDLTLTSNVALINSSASYMGNLDTLLKWHYQDGVSNAERKRTHQIQTLYQNNRNPFVDHPEYVWKVFGGGNNNSKLYVSASAPSDGASTATASLRVMKNGAWGTTAVNLAKVGLHPTTYDITASGNATTATAGVGQAFDYNTQNRSITIGMNASTATTGLKTGSITIDNTDLTSGGAGLGSADGNDVITVNGQVVDNRVITAGAAAFNSVIIGANVSANTTLTSLGDDNSNTRVTVNATASASDANGVFITAGSANTFNGTLTSAARTLQANFATPGAKSGSRSFSVTGEGLAGEVVNGVSVSYTATALDHAQPSLDSGSAQGSTTIDFGYVPSGFAARTSGFSVYNRAGAFGAALTAALDVDGATGGSAQMTTSVTPSSNIPAGGAGTNYTATYTPTTGGVADVTHHVLVSDENLPGAASRPDLLVTAKGHTLTTATFPTTGFMNLFNGETYNTGAFSIAAGVTLTCNGLGTMTINGAQANGAGSTLQVTSGEVNVNSDAGPSSATLAVSASGTANVTFGSSQHLAALSANGATVVVGDDSDKTVSTSALSIAGGGKVDLTRNKLIVHGGVLGSHNGSNYSGVTGQVESGRNGGVWNGPGITTSMPDATGGSGYTGLGVALASEVRGIGPTDTDTWGGQAVTGSDVLVMYTYGGDANLSGSVDIDDYTQIDSNASLGGVLTGWFNGDFDYNGISDIDDYTIIDSVIGIQGLPFPTAAGQGVALSAVPEPVLLTPLALVGAMLRRRSRRAVAV